MTDSPAIGVIVVVAGVAGSGKTTVGKLVAARLHCVFADGDDFHPVANVAKMHAGIPLTDDDRWPWLRAIASWMDERAAAGGSAVVACSVLRRAYREVLLTARARPRMMFLVVPHDICAARLAARHGHFFGADLLDSQFATLELPRPPEPVDLVPATGSPDETADDVVALLARRVQPPIRLRRRGPGGSWDQLTGFGVGDVRAGKRGSQSRRTWPALGSRPA